MAGPLYADRVQESSTTTGTGTYSLAGAVTGFQGFVAGIGNANTCYYCAIDVDGDGVPIGGWEVGLGTVADATPDTLARTSILSSSNAGAAVDWAAGTRRIFVTHPASQIHGVERQMPSGVNSVTFSNLDLGAFTDLEILFSARGDDVAATAIMDIRFNGDTGANYDREFLGASAATPVATEAIGATGGQVATIPSAGATAGLAAGGTIRIFDYRGTTFQKQVVSHVSHRTTTASGGTFIRTFGVGWRSAAAITSVTLLLQAGNFVAGSTFMCRKLP